MEKYLLWHNSEKLELTEAIGRAKLHFMERIGLPASHVALPPGEYPQKLAGLIVTIDPIVKPNYLEIHTIYQTGDVVCMECGEIIKHNPAITSGVSHGYCKPCGEEALNKFEKSINARLKVSP